MTSIYHAYSGIYLDYYVFQFIVFLSYKKLWKMPPQVSISMYRCISRRGIAHEPLKSMFYWAFIHGRYLPGIYQVYVCHMNTHVYYEYNDNTMFSQWLYNTFCFITGYKMKKKIICNDFTSNHKQWTTMFN